MKLLTLLILISLTLSGCHIERAFDYPDEYKGYYFHGKYPTKGSALAEQTKKDMLDYCHESKSTAGNIIEKQIEPIICDFELSRKLLMD